MTDITVQEALERVQDGAPLSEALGFTDEMIEAIEALGVASYQEGQLDKARKIFEGLVSLNPHNPAYWSALGGVLTRMEEHEDAIPILTVALELAPDDPSALVNRGECLMALGQAESAAKDLERAIELDPTESDPASNRARQLVFGFHELFSTLMAEGLDDIEIDDEEE